MVHAHFHHGHLGILRHSQNCHGHTDVVIVIGRGLGRAEGGLHHLGNHFLGGAFAHRAGNAHHLHTDAHPLTPGNLPQGQAGIGHIDGRIVPHHPGAQHRSGTVGHGIVNELVAVSDPLKGDEQLPRLEPPGIVGGTQEFHIGVFLFHCATAPGSGLAECNLPHFISSILPGGLQPLPARPGDALRPGFPGRFHGPFLPVQLYHLFSQCP